jgi:hypothetical protein
MLTLFVGHLHILAQAVPEGGVVIHCGVDKHTTRHGHGSHLQGRQAGGGEERGQRIRGVMPCLLDNLPAVK